MKLKWEGLNLKMWSILGNESMFVFWSKISFKYNSVCQQKNIIANWEDYFSAKEKICIWVLVTACSNFTVKCKILDPGY